MKTLINTAMQLRLFVLRVDSSGLDFRNNIIVRSFWTFQARKNTYNN